MLYLSDPLIKIFLYFINAMVGNHETLQVAFFFVFTHAGVENVFIKSLQSCFYSSTYILAI